MFKIKKLLAFTFIFILIINFSSAQTNQVDTSEFKSNKTYQIQLKEPVKCIQELKYDKTGEEIDGQLSRDRKTIYLNGYIMNTKVKVKVLYENGKEEEFVRSPCSIQFTENPIL